MFVPSVVRQMILRAFAPWPTRNNCLMVSSLLFAALTAGQEVEINISLSAGGSVGLVRVVKSRGFLCGGPSKKHEFYKWNIAKKWVFGVDGMGFRCMCQSFAACFRYTRSLSMSMRDSMHSVSSSWSGRDRCRLAKVTEIYNEMIKDRCDQLISPGKGQPAIQILSPLALDQPGQSQMGPPRRDSFGRLRAGKHCTTAA